jgi:hypothetical protein
MNQSIKPTKEQIELACREVISGKDLIDERKIGKKWELIFEGHSLPPIEIMRRAAKKANPNGVWLKNGGTQTNNYLTKLGFKVVSR